VTASITVQKSPEAQYLLRLGDTCLISGQRLGEWCGHGPVLEEDIALANMALDLIGQARALLSHAGRLTGPRPDGGHDEDQLAFLRDERDYLNPTLVELPNALDGRGQPGDFALTVLRNLMVSTFLKLLWQRLEGSSDAELAGIAGKAVKEARYHQQHAADWVVRLGDGTPESQRRCAVVLPELWRYAAELFEADEVDEHAHRSGLGPRWSDLQEAWTAEVAAVLDEAGLAIPPASNFRSSGKTGVHSEHMGYLLAEMQSLQRSFPGGAW
jgi:ring-1,2-phenylacetyl-CoA epoxidase subunit PaaC